MYIHVYFYLLANNFLSGFVTKKLDKFKFYPSYLVSRSTLQLSCVLTCLHKTLLTLYLHAEKYHYSFVFYKEICTRFLFNVLSSGTNTTLWIKIVPWKRKKVREMIFSPAKHKYSILSCFNTVSISLSSRMDKDAPLGFISHQTRKNTGACT